MATDGPTPPHCNPEIFKNGKGVCVLDGSSNAIERWVQAVAKKANAHVDWHYSGGRANVLHLGDDESRQRVLNAIEELKDELDGHILSIDGPALYREGDKVPEGTVAIDPDLGPLIAKRNPPAKIRDKLAKMLYDHGLFEQEAKGVLDLYENSPLGEAMKGRMNDDESGYPPQVIGAAWLGVRASAVKWIDENKPQHWARGMFVD